MNSKYETVRTLNQLIRLHYDRFEAYNMAASYINSTDERLSYRFQEFRNESKKCIYQLAQQVVHYGGTATHTPTVAGRIFRVWMRTKAAFLAKNTRTAVLDSCHFGEFIIQKAYQNALEQRDTIPEEILIMMLGQDGMLKCASGSLTIFHTEALLTS